MAHTVTIELDRQIFKDLKRMAEEDGCSPAESAVGIIEDYFEERDTEE